MTEVMQNPGNVTQTRHRSQGGRLVGSGGEQLPLRSVDLRTEAEGGIARTELRQLFANPHDEPLKLSYTFPLPADGAVAGFDVRIGDRVIRGEIDRREAARQRYDRALIEGRTAARLDEERANLFTQNLGNVPPRTEVSVVIRIDQPLAWLPDGAWEWRFPTVAAPRYLGANGRVPDAERVTVDVADGPLRTRASLELVIGDEMNGGVPNSPTHTISIEGGHVAFGDEATSLDRDVVVRWPVASPKPGVRLCRARPAQGADHANSAYGLLTIVPPSAPWKTIPRDVIVLLDTSGSMQGRPLDHAKRLVGRLIDSLTASDRLEMVAFASTAVPWKRRPADVTDSAKRAARQWVDGLHAGGGTEMVHAIHEALRPLRKDAVRQVVLVTDGLVGFESEAVRSVRESLPEGSRLHTVGVGSATHQAFLRAAARAGRGVEILVGLDEPVDAPGERIVAATHGPALVDVRIEGSALETCAPKAPADLMSASPVLQGLRLRPEGGELTVRARGADGSWKATIELPPTAYDEGSRAVTALVGRESVEDLELDLACGADRSELDARIERIGLDFGIATRLTSWIAISEEPTVDVRQPVRVERIPQELPYGMSAEGLGLSAPGPGDLLSGAMLDAAAPRFMLVEKASTLDSMPLKRAVLRTSMEPQRKRPAGREVDELRRLTERLSEFVRHLRRLPEAIGQGFEGFTAETRESLERLIHELRALDELRESGRLPGEQIARSIPRLLESAQMLVANAERLSSLADEMRAMGHRVRSDVEAFASLAEDAAAVTVVEVVPDRNAIWVEFEKDV